MSFDFNQYFINAAIKGAKCERTPFANPNTLYVRRKEYDDLHGMDKSCIATVIVGNDDDYQTIGVYSSRDGLKIVYASEHRDTLTATSCSRGDFDVWMGIPVVVPFKMRAYEPGQLVEKLCVRDKVVYVSTNDGYYVPCGILSKKDYTWGEDVDVPDMNEVTLVVLEFDPHDAVGVISFGMKHLTNKGEWFKEVLKTVIEKEDDVILYEIADAWIASKRPKPQTEEHRAYDDEDC